VFIDPCDIVPGECIASSKFEITKSLYSSLHSFKDTVLSTITQINQHTGVYYFLLLASLSVNIFIFLIIGYHLALALWFEKGLPSTLSNVQQALCTFVLEYPYNHAIFLLELTQ
jgi:hypothetical protein